MKEKILTTRIEVYPNIEDLSKVEQELLELSKASLEHSYSPYSNFKVGAAVLMEGGRMLGGSNQENASYPLCLCAERVALSAAASVCPSESVIAIAVTAKGPNLKIDQPISPCGACRQVICETELKHKQNIRVILQGEIGEIYVFETAKDLLPLLFDGSYL